MCRVLVVDDHEGSRKAIVEFLENEGHAPVEASNGQEALDWLRAQADLPCIILLDLRMPVTDGWDFLRAVHTVPKWGGIPIIVVSATIDQHGLQPVLPAKAFWSKPLDQDKMRGLHSYCDQHRDSWVPKSRRP